MVVVPPQSAPPPFNLNHGKIPKIHLVYHSILSIHYLQTRTPKLPFRRTAWHYKECTKFPPSPSTKLTQVLDSTEIPNTISKTQIEAHKPQEKNRTLVFCCKRRSPETSVEVLQVFTDWTGFTHESIKNGFTIYRINLDLFWVFLLMLDLVFFFSENRRGMTAGLCCWLKNENEIRF